MAKINDRSLHLFFYSSLTGPTSQPHKPCYIKSLSREGYTRRIVWQYYTKAWYSIGKLKFSKTSYAIPKLHQYLPGNFVTE